MQAMEKLYKKEIKKVSLNERSKWTFSFFNACAMRLSIRLNERKMTTSAVGTGNLPALRSLYDQAKEEYEQWKKEQKMDIKEKNSLAQINSQEGALAGIQAGNDIGLDTQISNPVNTGFQLPAQ